MSREFLPRNRRGNSPPIPDHLGDDVTLAQKKRLAQLAKMGCGPLADRQAPQVRRGRSPTRQEAEARDDKSAENRRQLLDRRAMLLEREKKIREQERREEEEVELEEQRRRARPRPGGMKSLGPVMPREDRSSLGTFDRAFPTPKQPAVPAMEVKISSMMRENVRASSSSAPGADAEEADEEEDIPKKKLEKNNRVRQEEPTKKKSKKKKKRKGRDDDEEDHDRDESWSEEDAPKEERRQQAKDGGAYKNMVVESVKGKVSNDYKAFTDAELERRFGAQSSSSAGGLMSEQEVRAMIKQEKAKVGHKGSSFRRVQREREEWDEQRRQRMMRRSRSREHLVVTRK